MTGSDVGWGRSAPFLSRPSRPPKRPDASFPAALEPSQSLVSRGWSLGDLGLWAFGMGEDMTKLAESHPQASSGHGSRRMCSGGTRPLAWMDLDGGTVPHAIPSP